jgi:phosphoribosyl-ATP pyrophosphohydrolase
MVKEIIYKSDKHKENDWFDIELKITQNDNEVIFSFEDFNRNWKMNKEDTFLNTKINEKFELSYWQFIMLNDQEMNLNEALKELDLILETSDGLNCIIFEASKKVNNE